MLSGKFRYATLTNYSPCGSSDISQQSRKFCADIKAGRVSQIEDILPYLRSSRAVRLKPFLNTGVVFVPAPRSVPLEPTSLWPAGVIAAVLEQNGFGRKVLPLLERTEIVRKSSFATAEDRPLIDEHKSSMRVEVISKPPRNITLVDDVLTMGRTSFACASLLKAAFPNSTIRIFALIRTQGLIDDIEEFVDPSTGTVKGFSSGKARRFP